MPLDQLNLSSSEIHTFQQLKERTENLWESAVLDESYGFQIQKDSKWNLGLTEEQLSNFQTELGFVFPESLKNFYRVMNGLDKPGINIYGDLHCSSPAFSPNFYAYPDDIDAIKAKINWIFESNAITEQEVRQGKAPFIFPFFSHRFLILDENEQVLSMHGSDIIYWADTLVSAIVKDTFSMYHGEITLNPKPVQFWIQEDELLH